MVKSTGRGKTLVASTPLQEASAGPLHPLLPAEPWAELLTRSSLQHLTAPPSPGPLRTQPRGRLKPPGPSLLCRSAGLWAGGIGGIQTNGPPDSDLPSCFFTSRGLGQGLGAAGLGRVDTSWQCFLLLLFLKLHTSLENNVAGQLIETLSYFSFLPYQTNSRAHLSLSLPKGLPGKLPEVSGGPALGKSQTHCRGGAWCPERARASEK